MARSDISTEACLAPQALFDPAFAARMLCADAGLEWTTGSTPDEIRIERGWPQRGGGFTAEWSFQLDGRRHSVYASTQPPDGSEINASRIQPTVTPTGLRSLDAYVRGWQVRLHTPDCDPGLPQLAQCLDPSAAGPMLAPYGGCHAVGQDDEPAGHLLGYRAGKRAAIRYDGPRGATLLGKTFRDHRGERLIVQHTDLGTRLRQLNGSGPKLRVAAPLGYLPALNMALFEWCHQDETSSEPPGEHGSAFRAADALSVLHALEGHLFPVFSRADERAVILRWDQTLRAVAPGLADRGSPIVAGLLCLADSESDANTCTVHRDFYEKQLIGHSGEITLLDLDTLATGSPCIDLGNLLAHLCLSHTAGSGGRETYTGLAAAVIERYARRRGTVDRSCMAFYWASAAYRVGAVHALRTSTRASTSMLWGLAEALLHREGALSPVRGPVSFDLAGLAPVFRWTKS